MSHDAKNVDGLSVKMNGSNQPVPIMLDVEHVHGSTALDSDWIDIVE
jgi:hypothetical protein